MRAPLLIILALFLTSCSSEKKPAPTIETPKPHDESRRFPTSNLVDTKVIDRITDHERGLILNYLRITNLRVGVILNFKHRKLE